MPGTSSESAPVQPTPDLRELWEVVDCPNCGVRVGSYENWPLLSLGPITVLVNSDRGPTGVWGHAPHWCGTEDAE